MSVDAKYLEEISGRGMNVLLAELGPIDTARFLQHFAATRGDYAKERHKLFGNMTVDELIEEFEADKSIHDRNCQIKEVSSGVDPA